MNDAVWDIVVDSGWGPEVAAASALAGVRGGDLDDARRCYARLVLMMRGEDDLPRDKVLRTVAQSRSVFILQQLKKKITEEERAMLRAPA